MVRLLDSSNVITSGSVLVTKLSHAVMRRVIGNQGLDVNNIVDRWVNSAELLPDRLVFVYALEQTIRDRIASRQLEGRTEERFWGFNSPFFLTQYQEALLLVASRLTATTDLDLHVLDSSLHAPDELVLKSQKF